METQPTAAEITEPPFSCRVSVTAPHRAEVQLHGDLDLANAPLLRDELLALLADGTMQLDLDLRALRFMDSSGIAALVVVRKSATERGGELSVRSASPAVRRVLEACGVEELFHLPGASRA